MVHATRKASLNRRSSTGRRIGVAQEEPAFGGRGGHRLRRAIHATLSRRIGAWECARPVQEWSLTLKTHSESASWPDSLSFYYRRLPTMAESAGAMTPEMALGRRDCVKSCDGLAFRRASDHRERAHGAGRNHRIVHRDPRLDDAPAIHSESSPSRAEISNTRSSRFSGMRGTSYRGSAYIESFKNSSALPRRTHLVKRTWAIICLRRRLGAGLSTGRIHDLVVAVYNSSSGVI